MTIIKNVVKYSKGQYKKSFKKMIEFLRNYDKNMEKFNKHNDK